MGILLDFDFLAILNLFVLLLWPASAYLAAPPERRNALSIIVTIITVLVVLGDIFFLVLKMAGRG